MRSILRFEGVSYRYPGHQRLALDGFSLDVPAGERIAVIGRNGSGKSTFFLHCNGLLRPYAGVMYYDGTPVDYGRDALQFLRQHVGICFQNPDDQLFSASVAQDISFGPLNLDLSEETVKQRVRSAAELCEIADLLERPTHALSGGEKARVALAGVLAMEPEVLIVDELMANLDPWVRAHIFNIFERLHRQGKTILLATHDMAVIAHWATFVVMMERGRAVYAGPAGELLSSAALMAETGLAEVWSGNGGFGAASAAC